MVIQRAMRPKVSHWFRQRAEAKRLMQELSEMLENTREAQAAAAFARRYDAAARDIDEVSNGEMDDNAMEEYLDELRRAVGIIN